MFDEFHECFKIDLVAYAVNNMSRLKNILQTFKAYNLLSLSCWWTLKCKQLLVFNIYEHDEFCECFKIDICAYEINMSRLENLLQIFYKHSNYVAA